MDYAEVLANAKKNIGPNCKVCPECNGLACANTMPGPGSKAPGNGANDNWKAWRGIKLNMDTIFPDAPVDTGIELFGKRLSMPLISAPVGSLKAQYNPTDDIRDFNECCAQAAEICGIASSFGDGLDARVFPHGCELSKAHGGIAIPVINPLSMETIKANLDLANAAHPFAVSLVIDSAGLPHLKKVSPDAGAKSVEQLRELCEMLEELERLREGFAKYYPSMAQDVLIHQRQTEVELLNGAIVRYGRELGIPTPVNGALTLMIQTIQQNYDKQYCKQ